MLLENLVKGLQADREISWVDVKGITADSRQVEPGFLFVNLSSDKDKGETYSRQAVQNGAIAVLSPEWIDGLPVPVIKAEGGIRAAMARAASLFYKDIPSVLTAVTGTNGKTSTVYFERQIWKESGIEGASFGTIGVFSDKIKKETSLTTPESVEIYRDLEELASAGVTHAALEASSAGLDQGRLDGMMFDAAAFTNLTEEHLDYHKTMESYFAAKAKLFEEHIKPDGTAVLNADIAEYEKLKNICLNKGLRVLSYGRHGEDILLEKEERLNVGYRLTLKVLGKEHTVDFPVSGDFQIMNLLCALGLVIGSGLEPERALKAVSRLKSPPGRLEFVGQKKNGAKVYVDYAHTPDALENVLKTMRPLTRRKLWVVFGCGGNRDKTKRPLMGKIAQRLADKIIITDDNPRFEDAKTIRQEILAACQLGREIGDRRKAIAQAIEELEKDDVLIIAGKGHEEGQIVNGKTLPFNDRIEAQTALLALEKKPLYSGRELKEILGGVYGEDFKVYGLSVDSRTVKTGDLFFALKGGFKDGHDFLEQAFQNGAAACVVRKIPTAQKDSTKLFIVNDPETALEQLASYARTLTQSAFVTLSGVAGKTSVKSMLAQILRSGGSVYSSADRVLSFVSVMRSVAQIQAPTNYSLLEMPLTGAEEMRSLSCFIQPEVALILNTGSYKLNIYESEEAIARILSEAVSGVKPGGTIVLNRDDPFYEYFVKTISLMGVYRFVSFGEHPRADFRLLSFEEPQGISEKKENPAEALAGKETPEAGKNPENFESSEMPVRSEVFVDAETSGQENTDFSESAEKSAISAAADVSFAYKEENDEKHNKSGYSARVSLSGKEAELSLKRGGRIWALDALAALAAAQALNFSMEDALAALSDYSFPKVKEIRQDLSVGGKKVTVAAGLSVYSLSSLRGYLEGCAYEKTVGGRRLLLLKEVPDLGKKSEELHLSFLSLLDSGIFDKVFCVGRGLRVVYDRLEEDRKGFWEERDEKTISILKKELEENDLLFIKGFQQPVLEDIFYRLQQDEPI